MRQKIKQFILISLGLLSVFLGVLGVFLPVLPTTPFLILALTCFAKSSPRFHHMLLNNRWFGKILQQWEQNHSITRQAKTRALFLVLLTFTVSIILLNGNNLLQVGLLLLGSTLLVYLKYLKEEETLQ